MNAKSNKNLNDLPPSSDLGFWGEGQKYTYAPRPIKVCGTHGKNWMTHTGYIDNHDGTVTCKWCPWGTQIIGYLKVLNERIIDLRSVSRE